MKLQFKLTDEQAEKISNQYPAYFGGDLRDSIGKWGHDFILKGCQYGFDYDGESEKKFIVEVDTMNKDVMLNITVINEWVSDFKKFQ